MDSRQRKLGLLVLAGAVLPLFQAASAQAAVITMSASDSGSSQSSYAAGTNWTGSAAPTGGNTYTTGAHTLNTANAQSTSPATNYTFLGDSLTVSNSGALKFYNWINAASQTYTTTYTINNLIFDGGGVYCAQNGVVGYPNTAYLAGNITLTSNGGKWNESYNNTSTDRKIIVTAPISGVGPLILSNSGSSSTPVPLYVLASANSYQGGTTIGNGCSLTVSADGGLGTGNVTLAGTTAGSVLVLQGGTTNQYIASTGTLTVPAGLAAGSMKLNYVGADVVASVSLNGTTYTSGSFGAPGSGATYEDAVFSGTGLISVPEPASLLLPGLASVMALARRRRQA